MNASPNQKKKKNNIGVDLEETRKPKVIDVSLLNNEVLRPWTIDINSFSKMKDEAFELEKTKMFTSPPKWGGLRGSSELESKPFGYDTLRRTVHKTIMMKEEDYVLTPSTASDSSNRSGSAGFSSTRTNGTGGKNTTSSRLTNTAGRVLSSNRIATSSNRDPDNSSINDLGADPATSSSSSSTTTAAAATTTSNPRSAGSDRVGTGYSELQRSDVDRISQIQRQMYLSTMRQMKRTSSPLHGIAYQRPYQMKTQSVKSLRGVSLKKTGKVGLQRRVADLAATI